MNSDATSYLKKGDVVVSLPAWRYMMLIGVLVCLQPTCSPAEDMVGTQERLLKKSEQWPQVAIDQWAGRLSDTRQAWKRLKAQTIPWKAHIVRTFRYLDVNDQSMKSEDRIELDLNGNAKCLLLTKKKKQDLEVVGFNDQYAFRLKGVQTRGDRKFEIEYVGDDQREADEARDLLFSSSKLAGIDAMELTQSDGFKIQGVRHGEGPESHLIRFDYLSSYSPRPQIEVSGGYLIVDTTLNCAICECRLESYDERIHDDDHHWFQIETTKFLTTAGVVPVASQSSSGFVGHPAHILAAEEFQRMRPADLGRGECTLSAFGIPEPSQAADRSASSNTVQGLKILAVALLMATCVFFWLRQLPSKPNHDRENS